jgi:hypothetical protein
MFRSTITATVLGLALGLAGCASSAEGASDTPGEDLEALTEMMTGTFDSTAQSAADPEAFHPIRLVMLPIWEDRADGPWLYVEQAVIGTEDRPYRQRVYRLSMVQLDELRSDVYELPDDPKDFVAAWNDPDVWKTCEPEDLMPRQGCEIYLRRRSDGSFAGETRGTGCSSRIGDAEYATSQVVITPAGLTSWDRGYSADGRQAWGAEKGPYDFRKTSSGAP